MTQSIFPPSDHPAYQEPCPKCSEQMQGKLEIRHGKHGPFLGCDQYPACDYIRPLHQNDGHVVKALGVLCPDCGDEHQGELVLRQGRYGMFIGCDRFPDCEHVSSLHDDEEAESEEQISCPECKQGSLVERQSRFGKSFYACDAYPKCKFALNTLPVVGQCQKCGYPLLTRKVSKKNDEGALICADRHCQSIQE